MRRTAENKTASKKSLSLKEQSVYQKLGIHLNYSAYRGDGISGRNFRDKVAKESGQRHPFRGRRSEFSHKVFRKSHNLIFQRFAARSATKNMGTVTKPANAGKLALLFVVY